MSAGAEVTQTLESSASTYTGGIEGRSIGGNTPEVYFSAITNKKPAARATARRSAVSSADSAASLANAAYTGNLVDCGNSMFAALSCRFSAASQSATVFFALYDEASNLIGVSRDYSFQGDAVFTDGTLYVSTTEIVDLHAAAKYFPVLRTAPTSGTVDMFVEHL